MSDDWPNDSGASDDDLTELRLPGGALPSEGIHAPPVSIRQTIGATSDGRLPWLAGRLWTWGGWIGSFAAIGVGAFLVWNVVYSGAVDVDTWLEQPAGVSGRFPTPEPPRPTLIVIPENRLPRPPIPSLSSIPDDTSGAEPEATDDSSGDGSDYGDRGSSGSGSGDGDSSGHGSGSGGGDSSGRGSGGSDDGDSSTPESG